MIDITWKTGPTLASLRRLQSEFHPAMTQAVENVFTLMMVNIVLKTPKPGEPPEPASQRYVRTGRLVNGWAKAAAHVGIALPTPTRGVAQATDSQFVPVDTADEISRKAINTVPYGQYVENGAPTVTARHMVGSTLMQLRDNNVLATEVREAWRRL